MLALSIRAVKSWERTLVAVSIALLMPLVANVARASAQLRPFWKVTQVVAPTDLAPGSEGDVIVEAVNLGGVAAKGSASPIVVTDSLPEDLVATGVQPLEVDVEEQVAGASVEGGESCAVVTTVQVSCTEDAAVEPYVPIRFEISVTVPSNAKSGVNSVDVDGGEAAVVDSRRAVTVSSTPASFGVETDELIPANEDGSVDTQAGSHPYSLTTTFALNKRINAGGSIRPVGQGKDVHFELPPGLVGNVNAVAQCSTEQFTAVLLQVNECQASTAVGVAELFFGRSATLRTAVPVFNLTPHRGEPARFGFEAEAGIVRVYLDTSIRTGSDYGVTVESNNTEETLPFDGAQVTLWGVPGASSHDPARGWCVKPELAHEADLPCGAAQSLPESAFLTLPTSCTGTLESAVTANSWEAPETHVSGGSLLRDNTGLPVGLEGCDRLNFDPSISVAANGQAASTPTGLTVGVHVPQQQTLAPEGLAQADVESTTVTLPAGVQLSPSAADGLQACSDAQIGFEGVNAATGVDEFSPAAPTCPNASKVATVRIKTPLLANELTGAVYLASPQNFAGTRENPFESLVAMYIVAEDPVSGVLVKLPGRVSPDPSTGQLTATFDHTPQLPFEDLALEFFGSDRAPLTTPASCGSYTTNASIAPWSGNPAATPSSSFDITAGPDETPCSDPRPFAPGFESGSTNLQASAFTPFTLTMTRPDADQTLSRVEMQMPPGLLGTLSSVKLCPEPQASKGECGEESLIGHTIISAGLGGDPYTVTGGKVYITTGYKGAPYGLSIVNPAAAGPFVLQEGRPVIVRASIFVDPHTAALRIVSDPLPTIIDGIPLQIQHVNVTIDRPGFTFNPSNCSKLTISGALSSSEGATAAVSTPFQVTNCATLAFKPSLAVSTAANSSKASGASLHVKLTYPAGAFDANIASVKVDLPKQLPSRLSTLQKACLAKVFEENPANCPKESIVGQARAVTPVLPVPLVGPAYFVSHGGEAFPSLIIVLQGYGVTVDLVGTTLISKGITSSTFKTVPDVPVGTFELTLPQGKGSALAANLPAKAKGSFCGQSLAMPTAFVGQNGAAIHESTKLAITGCAKVKKSGKKKLAKRHK
jgi:hypothetical protein